VIPRLATVLSAREWEGALVALARETAEVRVVLRAHHPEELESQAGRIDVVAAGTETPWLTPARISCWRRLGMQVIGMYPAGDRPARSRLLAAGVEELFPDITPATKVLRSARLMGAARVQALSDSTTIVVSGPRGAPGRTETAFAIAWAAATDRSTLLLDLDLEAPSLAIRTGRAPRPDIADACDAVAQGGRLPAWATRRLGPLGLIVGSHRRPDDTVAPYAAADLVEAARASYAAIVVDGGPAPPTGILRSADHMVLVVGGSPNGLVRAAHLVDGWPWSTPLLVLNRVPPGGEADALAAARHCLGLEPAAVVNELPEIAVASRRPAPPHRTLVDAARQVLDLLDWPPYPARPLVSDGHVAPLEEEIPRRD